MRPPGILTVRTRLFPEAGSVGGVTERKGLFFDHLVLMDIGDRDLGRGNEEVVEPLDLEELLLELSGAVPSPSWSYG